jgi:hypothetical protein
VEANDLGEGLSCCARSGSSSRGARGPQTEQVEDFLAIPDMIAGALAEQMQLWAEDPSKFSAVFWMHCGDFWCSGASRLRDRVPLNRGDG